MGKLIINVPEDIECEYILNDEKKINKIIKLLNKEEKKITNKEIDNIVGIWANRFDKDEKSDEIKRKWRIKNWKRF